MGKNNIKNNGLSQEECRFKVSLTMNQSRVTKNTPDTYFMGLADFTIRNAYGGAQGAKKIPRLLHDPLWTSIYIFSEQLQIIAPKRHNTRYRLCRIRVTMPSFFRSDVISRKFRLWNHKLQFILDNKADDVPIRPWFDKFSNWIVSRSFQEVLKITQPVGHRYDFQNISR